MAGEEERGGDSVTTSLELWLVSPQRSQPLGTIQQRETRLDEHLLIYEQGHLLLDGAPLRPGETFVWQDQAVRLVDATQLPPSLECYSEPFYGRLWLLDRESRIGRSGKRDNTVELEHSTISREHATLQGHSLRCDGERAVVIADGHRMRAGEQLELPDGALLQLGDLLFRLRYGRRFANPDTNLHVQSLRGFHIWRGRLWLTERPWHTPALLWVAARLAYAWGGALPIEQLQAEFWSHLPSDKARDNLNYAVSMLRQTLRGEAAPDPILRTTTSLQLNPEILGEHDVVQVWQHLQEGRVEEALRLYHSPYLADCQMPWALDLQEYMHEQVMQGAATLLERYRANIPERTRVAFKMLSVDRCSEPAHQALIESLLAQGRQPEALAQYRQCAGFLQSDLGIEPGHELQRLARSLQ